MRPRTLASRRRLYLQARVIIARHYRRPLTLAMLARALASSPRQVQRAFEQYGDMSFREELLSRRMSVAADLLAVQRSLSVAAVAALVGYRQPPHFARAFRARYGVPPARFRERALRACSEAGANARRNGDGDGPSSAQDERLHLGERLGAW